ncbi:MAG TPA: DinB family protein [Ktedonobacteraceae bacterium]|nr:DinB family protein [Ktedonobacteraceae bacterium]
MITIDFAALRSGQKTYAEIIRGVSYQDLFQITSEFFDTIQTSIAPATDADVTFVPNDPDARETEGVGWTLGHVVAHFTASLEESAALAAMLARGVTVEGRLRYETPWETIQTVQQVQSRLAESRRMSEAFLNAWPETPHLDVTVTRVPTFGPLNAIGAYLLGILHGQAHVEQVREIMRQAGQSPKHT